VISISMAKGVPIGASFFYLFLNYLTIHLYFGKGRLHYPCNSEGVVLNHYLALDWMPNLGKVTPDLLS
jgi:hypothetical protein